MELQTTQNNYIDFYGLEFFRLQGAKNISFEFKVVDCDDAKVPVIHIDGMNADASRVNLDVFPAYNATLTDLKELVKRPQDILFRIGFATVTVVDTETGDIKEVTKASKPKLVEYMNKDREWVKFRGKKHSYDENLNDGKGGYEPYENEDDLPKDKKPADTSAPATDAAPTEQAA